MTALAILIGIAAVLLACYPITKLALKHVEEQGAAGQTEESEASPGLGSLPTVSVPKMLYPKSHPIREHLFTASNGVELFSVGAFIDARAGENWYRAGKGDLPSYACSWFCWPSGESSAYETGGRCASAYMQWKQIERWAAKEKA